MSEESSSPGLTEHTRRFSGVVCAAVLQAGRRAGSTGDVQLHHANVAVWEAGALVRVKDYLDVDEASAAAERLAESRG